VRFGQKSVWQVLDGCERPAAIQIVPNREAAIEMAIRSSRSGEAILLAGWGASRWTTDRDRQGVSDIEIGTKLLREFCEEPQLPAIVAEEPALKIYRGRTA
jgi:UDP-N-acetylmuramyl tripeptide synthase